MTAANLVVRQLEAYLLTDTASHDGTGRLVGLESKVVASERIRFAIARNGADWPSASPIIEQWLETQGDEEAALLDFARLVGELRADARFNFPLTEPRDRRFNLFAAMWSPARKQPEGWIISSDDDCFAPGVKGGRAYQSEQYICPKADRRFYPPDSFDAGKQGLALLEAQRRLLNPHGRHTVGGAAQLTVVNENSAATYILRRWPDRIGQPIEPEGADA